MTRDKLFIILLVWLLVFPYVLHYTIEQYIGTQWSVVLFVVVSFILYICAWTSSEKEK